MSSLIIISGPSGSGQDSVIESLAKLIPIERVITTTTRAMRDHESPGHPYYFLSKEAFQKGIDENKFFEYAKQYNGEFYGVTFEEIERVRQSPKLGIWKVDYQGVLSAKKLVPGITAILLTAPLSVLEERIKRRDPGASEAFIAERMAYTKGYFDNARAYDFQVENEEGKLKETVEKVRRIVEAVMG